MLVQRRETSLRLIRQHDHALLAGELAGAWRDAGTGGRVRWRTVLGISLHDAVWIQEDRLPRLDPGTGRPHDFTTLPAVRKRRFVSAGVSRLEEVDPTVAELVRRHHARLAGEEPGTDDPELAWLRFFDNLSLRLCLTPPGSRAEDRPGWLSAGGLRPPGGGSLTVAWGGPGSALVDPFPFAGSGLEVEIPYRELPDRRFADDADLREAWVRAPRKRWSLALKPPDGMD